MITDNEIENLPGADVYAADGAKIGRAGTLYLDDDTGRPAWTTVHTGLFGTTETFVPITQAEIRENRVTVPYTKDQVKDAPRVDPDAGHLSVEEEQRLYDHYGLRTSGEPTSGRRSGTRGDGTSGREADAMTRSEERLSVGTQQHEAGRARLRKYVVTEEQRIDVPVTREEVRVEREPITDDNRGAALDGPELSEQVHEVTLHEERPVVQKETVPKERVRLAKESVTSQETVTGTVRKEQIDTDGVDETP